MNIFQRFFLLIVSNIVGLLAADRYITGFSISHNWKDLLILGIAFSLVNIFIKPVVSFFLKPLIYLTFGILSLAINAAIVFIISAYFSTIDITTTYALIWGTLIIALVNYLIYILGQIVTKHDNSSIETG